MKSEWKACKNYVCGEYYYQVYRLLDEDGIDHSGNREYVNGKTFDKKVEAQTLANILNKAEE